MRKKSLLFLSVLFLPIFSIAQLDKVYPGMTIANFHALFPDAAGGRLEPIINVTVPDTLDGIVGRGTYVVTQDSVMGYAFTAANSYSITAKKLNEDAWYVRAEEEDLKAFDALYSTLGKLTDTLSAAFGKPVEDIKNPFEMDGNRSCKSFRQWNSANGSILLYLQRYRPSHYNYVYEKDNRKIEQTFIYSVQIIVEGTNSLLQKKFCVGVPREELRKKFPDLAIWNKPVRENWQIKDTILNQYGYWGFDFVNDTLVAIQFSGQGYITPDKSSPTAGDSIFNLLRHYALQQASVVEKKYGKPDSLVDPYPQKPPRINKRDALHHKYYVRTDYSEYWKIEEGDFYIQIVIREEGGKRKDYEIFTLYIDMRKNEK